MRIRDSEKDSVIVNIDAVTPCRRKDRATNMVCIGRTSVIMVIVMEQRAPFVVELLIR